LAFSYYSRQKSFSVFADKDNVHNASSFAFVFAGQVRNLDLIASLSSLGSTIIFGIEKSEAKLISGSLKLPNIYTCYIDEDEECFRLFNILLSDSCPHMIQRVKYLNAIKEIKHNQLLCDKNIKYVAKLMSDVRYFFPSQLFSQNIVDVLSSENLFLSDTDISFVASISISEKLSSIIYYVLENFGGFLKPVEINISALRASIARSLATAMVRPGGVKLAWLTQLATMALWRCDSPSNSSCCDFLLCLSQCVGSF